MSLGAAWKVSTGELVSAGARWLTRIEGRGGSGKKNFFSQAAKQNKGCVRCSCSPFFCCLLLVCTCR